MGDEMTEPEFLTPAELQTLTSFKPAAKQDAWLSERGIPHRRDGSRMIVCRVHVRAWVEGRTVVSSNGPDWSKVA
jgi:hypothetical protein